MKMRFVKILAVVALFATAGVAQAEYVAFDAGANDVLQLVPNLVSDIGIVNARFASCSAASEVGLGSLAAGGTDVDYYSVALPAGCIVTAITTPYLAPFSVPDTTLGAFDPGGALIIANDDAGSSPPVPTRGSAIRFITSVAGVYNFAVSGFDDGLGTDTTPRFDGFVDPGIGHGEEGVYALTISVFPEPGTIAMLAAGLLMIARRRK
jgi:hypothetical protein